MRKIAIVTRELVLGGIEKALITMLKAIPKEDYDITVFVMGAGGELKEDLPENVKLECLYGYEKSIFEKVSKSIKKLKIIHAFEVGWYSILAKKTKTVFDQEMYLSKIAPIVNEKFDLAIAYHVPASFPVIYVINSLNAEHKVAWIHSDVSNYIDPLQRYIKYYEQYDKIFCVSHQAMEEFNKFLPNLKGRTELFYNMLDKERLKLLSETGEQYDDGFNGFKILTIGRLTSEKGQELIPGILKKLLSKGLNVRWYCIGDGVNRGVLEQRIKELHLKNNLILLGSKNNPYRYLRDCDLYVQPSQHEGYCITLAEARLFNRPIITTDFAGAREQIIHGTTGLIVEYGEDFIYKQILCLLNNNVLMQTFEKNLSNIDVENKSDISQLLKII
ncbi:glycosyltransferase [Fictibacillus fluitans]|uniref:Glycosyltransferase n=1 Tax=Fictibacillus fluitans TaxID=3058422 RepID=A0ABT8I117_9BACL|nr:glycosyltransferase [Fictibacillus sp. NE201]MDN4526719.1 glycosyltransferase [Fictibacillus sp. NE201]